MPTMPDLLLFDYGGVLLRLNDPLKLFGVGGTHAGFARRWLASPAVRAFETGRAGTEEFAGRVVAEFGLPYGPAEFIERFDRWPGTVGAATRALVRALPGSIDCAILSNTNPRHWERQDIAGDFGGRIGRLFLSYEMGCLKPDLDAFRHVIDATGVAPASVLFIDDSPVNVAAARRAGLAARHCPDVDALEGVLRNAGVVA